MLFVMATQCSSNANICTLIKDILRFSMPGNQFFSLIFLFSVVFVQQSAPSSPSNSSSSSDSSSDSDFEPGQKPGQGSVSSSSSDKQNLAGLRLQLWLLKSCHPPGPLRSMVEEIQSEESDDDDSTSEEEAPIKTNPPNRDSRSVSRHFLSFNGNS